MEPHRISVKLYLNDEGALDPEEVVPAFHRIVRDEAVAGIAVDVARYAHVVNGPGVMIIGHQQDHAVDLSEGRPGISATRKRDPEGTLADRIVALVGDAARLSVELQTDPALGSRADLRTDEILVTILDRYEAPNNDETRVRVEPALREVITTLSVEGGAATATVTREGTARDCFAVRITLEQPQTLAAWSQHATPIVALAR
ncbi:MAG: hypothetical protein EXQ74_02915 [Thermoleophilia bacterium]|nr:hypothetical protein [Thermoleophilia bacterium]